VRTGGRGSLRVCGDLVWRGVGDRGAIRLPLEPPRAPLWSA
jgi:hypothetical protein